MVAASTARANLLINGGLEAHAKLNSRGRALDTPTSPSTLLPGWNVTQGTVDLIPSSYWKPSKGRWSVDLIGTPGLGAISQTVTGLTIGADYELTFDFSINPDPREKGSTKILQVQAVGGSILNTETFQRVKTNESKGNMHYTHETFQFTADSTSVTLILSALAPLNLPGNVTPAKSLVGPVIDNLDLEPTGGSGPNIPEPASIGFLGAGAMLLVRRAKK
jgi:hypothetical protein